MSEEILLPYQRAWLDDKSPIKHAQKSRQIGFTWISAFEDVLDVGVDGSVPRSYYSSKDLSSVELLIDYCKFWAGHLNTALEDCGTEIIDIKKDATARVLRFKNGGKIFGTSSSVGALRGKNGKITLDEFAFHDDDDNLWDAAQPATIWDYPLRVFSTHNGAQTLFYKQIEEAKKGIFPSSVHTITLYDAVRQGMLDKIKKKRHSIEEQNRFIQQQFNKSRGSKNLPWIAPDGTKFMTSEAGKQEYLGIAIDESTAFMTYDFISRCTMQGILCDLENCTGDIYVGMDVARKKNLSVIWIIEKLGDIKYTRKVIILERMRFREQKEILYGVLAHKNLRRCCIDASGLGMQLAEEAVEDIGEYLVEGITLTNKIKEVLAEGLHRTMDDVNFLIPEDELINEDFHSLKKETTPSGHTRFDAKEGDDGSHADRFWAAALANYADNAHAYIPFEITSSGKSEFNK